MNTYDRRTFVKQSALLAGAVAANCLLTNSVFAQAAPGPESPHPFFKNMKAPEVIAHRGGAGEWPEETLFALEKAAAAGAHILEIDVRSTCDGVLVLMHDEEVGRTTGGEGCVKDYRFAQDSVPKGDKACRDSKPISSLDAGYGWPYCCKPRPLHNLVPDCGKPGIFGKKKVKVEDCCTTHPYRGMGITVPTLRDVLDAFKGWPNMRMIIEIKERDPSTVESFCELAELYKEVQDRILVASFYDTVLDVVRADPRCGGVALSVATCESVELAGEISAHRFLQSLGNLVSCRAIKKLVRYVHDEEAPPPGRPNHAVQVPGSLIRGDKDFVKKAQAKGLKVHAWTINDPAEMWQMMDAGVDGIITDYPSLLVERRKLWCQSRKVGCPA